MSTTYDALIDKAFELRKKSSFEESLIVARSALRMDDDSADAWWLIALNNESLENYDAALEAFEKSLELHEENAYRWVRFGQALKRDGQDSVAIDAFETALKIDPTQRDALTSLTSYYCWKGDHENQDLGFKYLKILDDEHTLTSASYISRLGSYYYAKQLYLDALRCFKKCLNDPESKFSFYNTGLSYLALGQKLNALDTWYAGIKSSPDYDKQQIQFDKAITELRETTNKIDEKREVLEEGDWYKNYLNPFELLNIGKDEDVSDINTKDLQNLKKLLLQEIDLEDGKVEWLNHRTIDKSMAIGLVDSLGDEDLKFYHSMIYKNKLVLNFLSRGDISLFLAEPNDQILEFTDLLSEENFSEWFSAIFAKQFDSVFRKIINSNNTDLYQLILSGRQWVNDMHLSDLFASSYDDIDKLLDKLREAKNASKQIKPSHQSTLDIIISSRIYTRLKPLPAQFIELQEEAAKLVRSIAINAMNEFHDSGESKKLLSLARTLIPNGSALTFDIEDDTKTINEIIENESKDESALSISKISTSIKKDGVRYDTQFIPANKVEAVCWGYSATREQYSTSYDYRFQFIGSGQTINVRWSGSKEGDKSKEFYDKHVKALLRFIFPMAMDYVKSQLSRGSSLMIGGCRLTQSSVQFDTKGWFVTTSHNVPWPKLRVDIANGDVRLWSIDDSSKKISIPIMSTPNSFVLFSLVKSYEG